MLDHFFQLTALPRDQLFGMYDMRLVILSYLVATFASYIALDITGRLRDVSNTRTSSLLWICGGAFAMGAGIWSMHFIGMLAFSIHGMAMSYYVYWTAISLVVAIGASWFALSLLKIQTINVLHLAFGGVVMGLAIASMHYLGMEGMKEDMNISYLISLFVLSIVIAIIASEAALWMAIMSNQVVPRLQIRLKVISAFIMGAAICGMHYTGMEAAVMTPKYPHMHHLVTVDQSIIAISVAAITMGIMGIAFFVSTYKDALNRQMLDKARQAGMAEIAASVLHNVGNVLNSVNVSANLLSEKYKQSKLSTLVDISELITQHKHDINHFIANDPTGKQIPDLLKALADYWKKENTSISAELQNLLKNVQYINEIIATQQNLSKVMKQEQIVTVDALIDEAILITGLDGARDNIHLEKKYDKSKAIIIDKVKLLQILVNLIRNSKDAVLSNGNQNKNIRIRTINENNKMTIEVVDNGIGIPPENLTRIFSYGYTTKQSGHGFGLHASALAVKEMGGSIKAESAGHGQGATFTVVLPFQTPKA